MPSREPAKPIRIPRRYLGSLTVDARARLDPVNGPDGRPLPWDIEFGFVGGQIILFQVRPLVERGQARADAAISMLIPGRPTPVDQVPLDGLPDTISGSQPVPPGPGSGMERR